MVRHFGLIGRDISYSFSSDYFRDKFRQLKLNETHSYVNFDIQDIEEIKTIVAKDENLVGFNVTIPYKEAIFPYLTEIDPLAKAVGAVNTVKITENGLVGYNTDVYGFLESIALYIKKDYKKALLLGTGGASKAVKYGLESIGMETQYVSRTASENILDYDMLTEEVMKSHQIIVNCTPVGTFPDLNKCPDIPYQFLSKKHLAFDLVYNPIRTKFLKLAAANGAWVANGFRMLSLQADKAWEIWNE
ncbi:shikimate dehydrogenase family protein [Joostella sp. CR20]|uniref:shikimate dehydrogenase family protein n=1 Tax=Joostella sp. CR20 TaxID=2804312 RepID=UPI00313B4D65